jgi:hypothetical protein
VHAVPQLATVCHARVRLLLYETAQPNTALDANKAAIGRRLKLGALAGMAFLGAERDATASPLGRTVGLVHRATHGSG